MAATLILLAINILSLFLKQDSKAIGRHDFGELRPLLLGLGRKMTLAVQKVLGCCPRCRHC